MQLFEVSTSYSESAINEALEFIEKAFLEESVFDVLGSAQQTLSQKRGMFQAPDANAVATVAAIMLYIEIQEGRTNMQGGAAFYEQGNEQLMDVLKYYIKHAPQDFARKKAEVIKSAKAGHITNDIRYLINFFQKRETEYDRSRRDGSQQAVGKAPGSNSQAGRETPQSQSMSQGWSKPTHSLV